MLTWMQLGYFIIALANLLRVLKLPRLAVDHQVCESHDPPPEHVLGASIQLRGKLVENAGGALSVECTTVVLVELDLHLALEDSVLRDNLGRFSFLLVLRVLIVVFLILEGFGVILLFLIRIF